MPYAAAGHAKYARDTIPNVNVFPWSWAAVEARVLSMPTPGAVVQKGPALAGAVAESRAKLHVQV